LKSKGKSLYIAIFYYILLEMINYENTRKYLEEFMEEIKATYPRLKNAIYAENIMLYLDLPRKAMAKHCQRKSKYYEKVTRQINRINVKKFIDRLSKEEK